MSEQPLCPRCHWFNKRKHECEAVNPPLYIEKEPTAVSECFFIPKSYWKRIPKERKKELEADARKRIRKNI